MSCHTKRFQVPVEVGIVISRDTIHTAGLSASWFTQFGDDHPATRPSDFVAVNTSGTRAPPSATLRRVRLPNVCT